MAGWYPEKPIEILESVLNSAKFAEWVCLELSHVRRAHENNKQTLERIIEMSKKIICAECRGSGRSMYSERMCTVCHGTGEKAYDPFLPIVKDVMDK